jgi:hypothetical protein
MADGMTDKHDRSDDDSKRQPKGTAEVSRENAGFDRWLTGHLREMYDEVLRESVPEDLVRMVRQFGRSRGVDESSDQRQAEDAEAGAHSSRGRSRL